MRAPMRKRRRPSCGAGLSACRTDCTSPSSCIGPAREGPRPRAETIRFVAPRSIIALLFAPAGPDLGGVPAITRVPGPHCRTPGTRGQPDRRMMVSAITRIRSRARSTQLHREGLVGFLH
jgi:hypothetical protein